MIPSHFGFNTTSMSSPRPAAILAHRSEKQMELGSEVFVKGVGRGVLALDYGDGTWLVEFQDDGHWEE